LISLIVVPHPEAAALPPVQMSSPATGNILMLGPLNSLADQSARTRSMAKPAAVVNAEAMAMTVDEVADSACVDPGDVLALAAMYPDDEYGIWEEEGVLSKEAASDIWRQLNWQCQRSIPELYPWQ
jgi:hypothetical protein